MKQQESQKYRNYSTTKMPGSNVSNKFYDLQDALRTVGRSSDGRARDITDVDSTMSRRGLMHRKLYLMKLMLKNEKNANQVMKEKIDTLGTGIHADNYTMRLLEKRRATHN